MRKQKYSPNETDQSSRKRTKQNIGKKSVRCRVKIWVIKMLNELSQDLNSIKKIQSEMKDSLIEIKNNLQGINSRVDEANNQINDLEHKEAKTTNQNNKKKKNPKKRRQYKQTVGQQQAFQHSHHRGARGEEEKPEVGNLFEKIMKENFLNLVEIDIQVQEAQRVPNKMV